jgi:hypothetical protein
MSWALGALRGPSSARDVVDSACVRPHKRAHRGPVHPDVLVIVVLVHLVMLSLRLIVSSAHHRRWRRTSRRTWQSSATTLSSRSMWLLLRPDTRATGRHRRRRQMVLAQRLRSLQLSLHPAPAESGRCTRGVPSAARRIQKCDCICLQTYPEITYST